MFPLSLCEAKEVSGGFFASGGPSHHSEARQRFPCCPRWRPGSSRTEVIVKALLEPPGAYEISELKRLTGDIFTIRNITLSSCLAIGPKLNKTQRFCSSSCRRRSSADGSPHSRALPKTLQSTGPTAPQ